MQLVGIYFFLALAVSASAVHLQVAGSGGSPVSPLQYGIIFEDINHSGDGGLYAELIQNRAFQANSTQTATIAPWFGAANAALAISTSNPLSAALPYSVQVTPFIGSTTAGLVNPGYWGINVIPQVYKGQFWARGAYEGNFTVALQSNITQEILTSAQIPSVSTADNWTQYTFDLNPPKAAPSINNTFSVTYDTAGASAPLQFNLLSLFPPTYNDRPNGMRIDLMETLRDLSPSFLRLPGGNNLEGDVAPNHWMWNQTVGPLSQRPGRQGQWGYYNTDGIGLDEYLDWCVDLSMEPVLGVWDGLYLNNDTIPQAGIEAYVQDVLNELEYITGAANTTYGALRAKYGHPEPWSLNYVEIGNEDFLNDGLSSYAAYRLNAFYSAITKAYPHIQIISSAIYLPLPEGVAGDYHDYSRPDLFTTEFNMFDGNTSANPTLIGEYAIIQPNNGNVSAGANFSEPRAPFPFWAGTVAEAIFLLGAERNAGAIMGAAYAPIFQNLDSYVWAPDLISFTADPGQDVRSTSYQLVELFSNTRSTETRAVQADSSNGPAYWAAGENTYTGSYIVKAAVYNSSGDVPMTVAVEGLRAGTRANLTVLTAPAADSYASIGNNPVQTTISMVTAGQGGSFSFSLPGLSIALLATEGKSPAKGHSGETSHEEDRGGQVKENSSAQSSAYGSAGQWGHGGYGGCKSGGQRKSYSWSSYCNKKEEKAGNGC